MCTVLCISFLHAQSPEAGTGKTYRNIPPNMKGTTKEDIYRIKNLNPESLRDASLTYYWINFNDAIDYQFNGGTLENLAIMPLWQDSTVKVVGNDGTGEYEFYWWIHSYASMLDPTSIYISDWVDNNYTMIGSASDWFNKDHAFVVDTIRFYYYYDRFDFSVTDTLKVWVMGPGSTAQTFGTLSDPPYNAAYIKYLNEENRPNGTSTPYTFLLDDDDTASYILRNIDIPVSIEIPKIITGYGNKISLAWSFATGQEYAFGDTLIDAHDVPIVTDPLNRFWLLTNEELLASAPISMDEGTYNDDGAATTEVRYDMSTTGWNGLYINTFAFLAEEYAYEHAYVDYHIAPKGVNFLAIEPSPCEDLTLEFTDLSNFVIDEADATYYWDFDEGGAASLEQNPTHVFSEPGTYNVCLVVSEGSVSYQYCKTQIVDNCVAIDGLDNISTFVVYPNPATDNLQVELTFSQAQSINLSIQNVQGQKVYTENTGSITDYKNTIDVSELPAGMYILTVAAEGKTSTKSFVVK